MAKRQPITKRKSSSRKSSSRPSPRHSGFVIFQLGYFLLRRYYHRSVIRWRFGLHFFLSPIFFSSPAKAVRKSKPKTIKLRQPTGVIFPRPVTIPFWQRYAWQLALSLVATSLLLGGSYSIYETIFKDLPAATELSQRPQLLTTKILDRNGHVLFRIYEDENRTLVPLTQVSPYMIQATIAIEDKEFYHHKGISISGITRALRANVQGEHIQGGSTITQQLVKLRLLSPERTLPRKIKEAIIAILVEQTYTKDEILEMYLNQVAYGGSTYGIEEAAHRYFNKSARDLSLSESALLAGLPAAPSIYTPFGPSPELARNRQAEVLRRMAEDGYITPEQADQARQEPLVLRPDTIDIQAPHFVMYVKKLLAERYGEDLVQTGGLEVTTTLDLALQTAAQAEVTQEVDKLRRLRINNGAALVTNPGTGEILAMVGSTNYFDVEHDGQVNVTMRPRQPGSSIKPITYSLAFERGLSPSSLIDDSPITYQIPGSKPYSPKNYDGRYHGRISLREALASSYNIPAVKLLASIGMNTMIDRAEDMGIDTWDDRSRFGLSLTLGGGEVTMVDLAEVYGTFANYGHTVELNPILEIKTSQGEVLYRNDCALDNDCDRRKTLDTRVAYQVTDVLTDNIARSPAFGPQSVLYIPNQQVAVKTGTTNNLRDNWTIGYTSDRLVAVWVGNNDNTPMSYVASGITGASPIWNHIMRLLLDENQPHLFASPESLGLIKVAVCVKTGTLPCAACPQVKEDYFVPGTQPTRACNPDQFSTTASQTEVAPAREQVLDGTTTRPPRAQQGG